MAVHKEVVWGGLSWLCPAGFPAYAVPSDLDGVTAGFPGASDVCKWGALLRAQTIHRHLFAISSWVSQRLSPSTLGPENLSLGLDSGGTC